QCADAARVVGAALAEIEPEALVLLGDRFETAAAALAATVARVPIAHLYGGEESVGAFDNALRHAITKLSHLHLVAYEVYARRILQMGEDPAAVHVVGSLGVENALTLPPVTREQIESRLKHGLSSTVGLVTVHPTTLAGPADLEVLNAVVEAMRQVDATWVVTLPNADPGNEIIRGRLLAFAAERGNVVAVDSLGEDYYLGVMRHCDVVLGNSSSGMTEAPAVGVPTVNVGERQAGRLRLSSIFDVPADGTAVTEAVRQALGPEYRAWKAPETSLGDAGVSRRIRGILATWKPGLQKAFRDLSVSSGGTAVTAVPMEDP
ncbi:MAG: UDP-N-acetylglucosamine 2-epimerase (hydrolyzing), partial [Deltaproteobacteria bacterium]|nr:UDP-N-acetylglucosamine 2-epimerase (hydrolyzing) [Deltaproteobacteria bacterium]